MGFPSGVQTVVLTGRVGLADGQSQRDKITITPSPPEVLSTTADFIMDDAPIEIVPDRATGQFSIRLVATDSTGINPTGWTYTVARGSRTPYSISLPAGTSPVDLADLTPASADPGVYTLLVPVAEVEAYADAGDAATLTAAEAYTDAHAGGSASPWVFDIEHYGAVPDVQIVQDAATNGTTATVTCASTRPFVTGDIGKVCVILHAGAAGLETFASPITGISSASTAALQDVPPTAVTGATMYFGTNAYAAQNAAVDAAEAYLNGTGTGAASKPHTYAQVYTPGNAYITHGPLQTSKDGYGQVVYGVFAETGHKVGLEFAGVAPIGAGVRHWNQLVPQGGGSCWISTFLFSSTSASNSLQEPDHNGIAGIISGPNEGQLNGSPWGSLPAGRSTPIYSNVMIMVRNMSFLWAYSSLGANIGILNAFGSANMLIENVSGGPLAIVGPSSDLASPAQFSASFGVGLVCPSPGNNDLSYIRNLSLQGGQAFGAWISEHTIVDRYMCLYSWVGLVMVGNYGGSGGATHAAKVLQASIEACTHELYLMGAGAQGVTMIDIDQLQTEDGNPNITGSSANAVASAVGRVVWKGLFTADNVRAQLIDGTPTPCGIEQVNGQQPRAIRRITGAHAVTVLDRTIVADTAAGGVTVTLPAADFAAPEYVFKNVGASSLTVATTSSQLIYTTSGTGATTGTVATGGTLRVQAMYNGSAWGWYAV